MAIIFVDSAATGANDGTSWTDARTSLKTALEADKIAPGDQVLVSGTFNETVEILEVAAATTPNRVQGDDKSGGAGVGNPATFTVDGQSTRVNCVVSSLANHYYVFKNMKCIGATGSGFSSSVGDKITFKQCQFTTNGGKGCTTDLGCIFEECTFDNNSSHGLLSDGSGSRAVGCLSYTNGGWGFQGTGGNINTFIYCLGYNNTSGFISTGANTPVIVGCTGDGENVGTGVNLSGTITNAVVLNNLIHDFATGISAGRDIGEMNISRNNLINSSSTADYSNFATHSGEIIDPGTLGLTNEAADDYTLTSASAAKAAGHDAGDVVNDVSYADIGAHQRQEAGGGSASGVRNPMGGSIG